MPERPLARHHPPLDTPARHPAGPAPPGIPTRLLALLASTALLRCPMEGGEEEVHHEEGEGVYGLSDQELLVYSSNLRYVNIPFVIAAFL